MEALLLGLLVEVAIACGCYTWWLRAYPRRALNLVAPGELERLRTARAWQALAFFALWLAINTLAYGYWRAGGTPAQWLVVAATAGLACLVLTVAVRSVDSLRRIHRFVLYGARPDRGRGGPSQVRTAQAAAVPVDESDPPYPAATPDYNPEPDWDAQPIPEKAQPSMTVEVYEPCHEIVHAAQAPEPAQPLTFRSLREASLPVIGQEQALRVIEDDLRLACAGLTRRADRPFATFLLAGASGVGKTETAHAIAEVLYGSRDRVAKFSMNEAQGEGGTWRAFGPPPGYKNADDGGLLTNRIKRMGHRCVVLIDELEKGPGEVFDALLTGLDTGDFMEAVSGEKVPIRECVVVLTTNAVSCGEDLSACTEDELRSLLLQYRRDGLPVFSPEFLGRIKRVLWYRALSGEDRALICRARYRLFYAGNVTRALGRNVPDLSPALARYLAGLLSESKGGVRSLDALIERTVLRAALDVRFTDERVDDYYQWDYVQQEGRGSIQLVRTTEVLRKQV